MDRLNLLFHKSVHWRDIDPDELYNRFKSELRGDDFEVFDEIITYGKPNPLAMKIIYSHVKNDETFFGIVRVSVDSIGCISTTFPGSGHLKLYDVNFYVSPRKSERLSEKVYGLLERIGLKETVEAYS